jgi:hypothetical protein
MRFGTLSVRGLYTAESLMTVEKETSKYKLDLVGVHEHIYIYTYIFLYGKGHEKHAARNRTYVRSFCT